MRPGSNRNRPLAAIALGALVAASPAPAAGADASAKAAFHQQVAPFLKTYCTGCHNPEKKKGKLTLHDISPTVVRETNADLWATVLDQIEAGEMPPEEAEEQPGGKARKAVADWIRSELGHAGYERDPDLLRRPEFGNHLDHDKLFDPANASPSYSLPRVWRRRAELYPAGSPFAKTEFDYAAMQAIGEPETLRLRALSEEVAYSMLEYMLGRKTPHRNSRNNPEGVRVYGVPKLADPAIYTGAGAPDRAQIEADIATLFGVFLHREPSAAELERYSDFLAGMLEGEPDREAALATAMRAMILTPEAIFRMELGAGESLPDGRRALSERELSIAVPMSLGRSKPVLGLRGRGDVEKAVRHQLKRDRATNGPGKTKLGISPRFMEFFRSYFGYHKAHEVFTGERHVWHEAVGEKGYTNAYRLADETDQIVAAILREDKDVLRQLLTTDQIVVTRRSEGGEKMDRARAFYEVDWKWNRVPKQKADRSTDLGSRGVFKTLAYMAYYNLEPGYPPATAAGTSEAFRSPVPRSGILTHPSWLIAHSTFTDNHVVLRGKWVREKLLGGSIPEVPVGVDAAIPDTPHLPLRERLKQTRDEACWRCHHRMDPLGYPFEIYDDFGRYRADGRERLINGEFAEAPADPSGEIIASGDPAIDGPVKNAVEMIGKIAGSERARQVFVRHAFRFFMGRNETMADAASLQRADRVYVDSGGSFEELVVSILTSDSFLYRKGPDAPATTNRTAP